MSKNLGKYKQELQTRECLVQAIYQYIFHESNLHSLIDQFLKENTPKKISFNYFKQRLENVFEQADDLKRKFINAIKHQDPKKFYRSVRRKEDEDQGHR